MRIINIDYNVKQRLNDIVGRTGSGPNGLTPWSVQEAMLSNIERLAAGLSGNSSYGRLLSGLHLSIDGATVTITAGYGITKSGKVIHLQSAVSHSFSGNTYFYLAYNKGPVQDSDPAGIISPFVGSTQSQQLVSDEAGTVYGTGVTWDQIIVTDADGSGQGNSDYIYLGSVISGVVSPSYQRGFVDAVGFNVMGSLAVHGDSRRIWCDGYHW